MVAATASTVAASASALSAEEVHEVLYLLVASLSLFEHSSLEVQRLSSQRMVEVHLHLVVGDVHHTSIESVAFLILKRHDSVYEDVLVVEVSVYLEYASVEVEHAFLLVVTVSLFFGQFEIKLRPRFQFNNILFKLVESDTES